MLVNTIRDHDNGLPRTAGTPQITYSGCNRVVHSRPGPARTRYCQWAGIRNLLLRDPFERARPFREIHRPYFVPRAREAHEPSCNFFGGPDLRTRTHRTRRVNKNCDCHRAAPGIEEGDFLRLAILTNRKILRRKSQHIVSLFVLHLYVDCLQINFEV